MISGGPSRIKKLRAEWSHLSQNRHQRIPRFTIRMKTFLKRKRKVSGDFFWKSKKIIKLRILKKIPNFNNISKLNMKMPQLNKEGEILEFMILISKILNFSYIGYCIMKIPQKVECRTSLMCTGKPKDE